MSVQNIKVVHFKTLIRAFRRKSERPIVFVFLGSVKKTYCFRLFRAFRRSRKDLLFSFLGLFDVSRKDILFSSLNYYYFSRQNFRQSFCKTVGRLEKLTLQTCCNWSHYR